MEAIDFSGEELTPFIVGRIVVGLFLAYLGGYALSRVSLHLAMRPLRRNPPEHWTERARLTYPVRITAVISGVLLVWILGTLIAVATFRPNPDLRIDYPMTPFLLATAIGCLASYLTVRSQLIPGPVNVWDWFKSQFALMVLIGSHWIVLAVMGSLMPEEPRWATLIVFLATMPLLACCALDVPVVILARLGLVQPASERLRSIVSAASKRTNTPYRNVFEAKLGIANAMVFESRRDLLFTSEALNALDDAQIDAICCHEFAHLHEPASAHRIRFARAFIFLPLILFVPTVVEFGVLAGGLGCLVPCFVFLILYQRFSQKMEHAADAFAARFVEHPSIYTKALERLHETSLVPAVMPHNRESHPHLYDRLLTTGVTPDYPRPPACAKFSRLGIAAAIVAIPIYLVLVIVLDVIITRYAP